LIHSGPALEYRAVHGDPLSRTHQNLITRPEAVRVYALFNAIAVSHGLACAESPYSVNRGARTQRTALFEEPPQFEEERNERRGHEAAGGGRRQDRDCHKLIGGPAGVSGDDSPNTRDERRYRDNASAKSPAQLSDLPLFRLDTDEKSSETKETEPNQSGAEPLADTSALLGIQNDGWLRLAGHKP
jgi:hypothetical protein